MAATAVWFEAELIRLKLALLGVPIDKNVIGLEQIFSPSYAILTFTAPVLASLGDGQLIWFLDTKCPVALVLSNMQVVGFFSKLVPKNLTVIPPS